MFTIQAVIHAAFVEVKDGAAVELFQFAAEEPPFTSLRSRYFMSFF